jgi:acyl carrier protein
MTTRSDDIAERVKDMLAQATDLPREDLVLNAPVESLGIDSLDVLKLLVRCEREFGVVFSTSELLDVVTLAEVVDKIGRKLAV